MPTINVAGGTTNISFSAHFTDRLAVLQSIECVVKHLQASQLLVGEYFVRDGALSCLCRTDDTGTEIKRGDRTLRVVLRKQFVARAVETQTLGRQTTLNQTLTAREFCLLYTSDAADED